MIGSAITLERGEHDLVRHKAKPIGVSEMNQTNEYVNDLQIPSEMKQTPYVLCSF